MGKSKIFKRMGSAVLAVAVLLSAISAAMYTVGATGYEDLSAVFDFEDGSTESFIQVGTRSGDEIADGFTAWNYDPSVGETTGLDRNTIEKITDYATYAPPRTSKALQAKPYYVSASTYGEAFPNVASAGKDFSGKISAYTLASTVGADNSALESLKKTRVSGKLTMDFYEVDGSANQATAQMGATPILMYYYKDINNWRGIRFGTAIWNGGYLLYQNIVSEEGTDGTVYTYTSAWASAFNTNATASEALTNYNNYTEKKSYTSYTGAIGFANAQYPVLSYSSSRSADYRFGEWLNFDIEYVNNGVLITLRDAAGLPFDIFVAGNTEFTLKNADGTSMVSSALDLSSATFALGVSPAIGNNSKRADAARQPSGVAFDDLDVLMTDSAETGVAAVISAIDSISDAASYSAAESAYSALTPTQQKRVNNYSKLQILKTYYGTKQCTLEFNEAWQKDIFSFKLANKTSVCGYGTDFSITSVNNNSILKYNGGYISNSSIRNAIQFAFPASVAADMESVTIDFIDGLSSLGTGNDASTINAGSVYKVMPIASTGIYALRQWGYSANALDIYVDLSKTFKIKLVADGANKCKISFIGTQLVDDNGDGIYTAGTDTNFESNALSCNCKITAPIFSFGGTNFAQLDNVEIKFAGWESVVSMTEEEQAVAALIEAIGEITYDNFADKTASVTAARTAYDALTTDNLQQAKPDGSEKTYAEILSDAENRIAEFSGVKSQIDAFYSKYNSIFNENGEFILTNDTVVYGDIADLNAAADEIAALEASSTAYAILSAHSAQLSVLTKYALADAYLNDPESTYYYGYNYNGETDDTARDSIYAAVDDAKADYASVTDADVKALLNTEENKLIPGANFKKYVKAKFAANNYTDDFSDARFTKELWENNSYVSGTDMYNSGTVVVNETTGTMTYTKAGKATNGYMAVKKEYWPANMVLSEMQCVYTYLSSADGGKSLGEAADAVYISNSDQISADKIAIFHLVRYNKYLGVYGISGLFSNQINTIVTNGYTATYPNASSGVPFADDTNRFEITATYNYDYTDFVSENVLIVNANYKANGSEYNLTADMAAKASASGTFPDYGFRAGIQDSGQRSYNSIRFTFTDRIENISEQLAAQTASPDARALEIARRAYGQYSVEGTLAENQGVIDALNQVIDEKLRPTVAGATINLNNSNYLLSTMAIHTKLPTAPSGAVISKTGMFVTKASNTDDYDTVSQFYYDYCISKKIGNKIKYSAIENPGNVSDLYVYLKTTADSGDSTVANANYCGTKYKANAFVVYSCEGKLYKYYAKNAYAKSVNAIRRAIAGQYIAGNGLSDLPVTDGNVVYDAANELTSTASVWNYIKENADKIIAYFNTKQ